MDISNFKNMIWDYTRKINENTNSIFSPVCERFGLTVLQVRILIELHRYESLTIGSLAKCVYAAGTNISAMCKKLEHMGFLKRVRDQEDERVVKVFLTENGERVIQEVNGLLDEKILENVSEDAEKVFNDIIKGMKKLSDLMENIANSHKHE